MSGHELVGRLWESGGRGHSFRKHGFCFRKSANLIWPNSSVSPVDPEQPGALNDGVGIVHWRQDDHFCVSLSEGNAHLGRT